ncbi:MAG: 2-dehydro-3-deoxyphosphooctonate aldolase [Chlamydiae bacterium]|nr:2-dehydro-3-deoxyphosphooctonate aldolase [Chlamydiota bacterium]
MLDKKSLFGDEIWSRERKTSSWRRGITEQIQNSGWQFHFFQVLLWGGDKEYTLRWMKKVSIKDFVVGEDSPLLVVSGPCVIESEDHAMECAEFLTRFFAKRSLSFVFKASYDKANRTSIDSFRGPGIEQGLKILEKIKTTFDVPVLTDVHSSEEAYEAAKICDIIQIPAFLARQTDIVVAAGRSGAVVNVKKGQFMAPWDMKNVINKLVSTGNEKILLTDRGTSFGYQNLVSDMRAIPIMQGLGYPVLFDATHSVQLPGGLGGQSGGQREFIPVLARAALASGCNGIFAESHPNPAQAKSDSASVLSFEALPKLVDQWERIYETMQLLCAKL